MRGNRLWRRIQDPAMVLGLGLVAGLIALAREPASPERELEWPFRPHYCGVIERLAFSPDGLTLTAAGADGAVARWDVDGGRVEGLAPKARGSVRGQALCPDGATLAAIRWDEAVTIRALEGDAAAVFLPRSRIPLYIAAFAPDARTLAAGGADGVVILHDVAGGGAPVMLHGPGADVVCLAFSPDGTLLAAGDRAGQVTLWDTVTRTIKAVLGDDPAGAAQYWKAQVRGLAFSPDGTELAVVRFYEHAVRRWNVASGLEQGTIRTRAHEFSSVAYAPRGGLIGAGTIDGTIMLWDAATSEERGSCRGHSWQVSALAFSPDGRVLASADGDSTVKLWEMDRWKRTTHRCHPHRLPNRDRSS